MSLIHYRAVEMHQPKKIALLIFVERGWVGKHRHLRAPLPHMAKRRHYFELNRTFSGMSPALGDWIALGAVRRSTVRGCTIETTYKITPKGSDILSSCPPELIAEARAYFRATLWSQILRDRSERKQEKRNAAWLEKVRVARQRFPSPLVGEGARRADEG